MKHKKCKHCNLPIRLTDHLVIRRIQQNQFCRECAWWIWGQLGKPVNAHIFINN